VNDAKLAGVAYGDAYERSRYNAALRHAEAFDQYWLAV
jgi:hypothetical protein